jgi:hypothetical protein
MTDADDQRRATAIREFLAANPEGRTPEPPVTASWADQVEDIKRFSQERLAVELAAIEARFKARRRFIGGEPTKLTKRDVLAAIADLNDDDVVTVIIARDCDEI